LQEFEHIRVFENVGGLEGIGSFPHFGLYGRAVARSEQAFVVERVDLPVQGARALAVGDGFL
jgi:hypothetical protein